MAYNFNKQGYSLQEVSQILHCSYSTTLRLVDSGNLNALIQDELTEGGRRRIRITRDQLIDYMRRNRNKIAPETLEAFNALDTAAENSNKEQSTSNCFIKGATTEPCGVWASLYKKESKTEEPKTEKTNTIKDKKTCSILVNGRICVSNILPETARTIMDALLQDTNISMNSITIEFKY